VSSTIAIEKKIKISELGLLEYIDAWKLQKEIQQKVINHQ
jgi:lipoyl(octanoyl) transferase